MLLGGLAYGSIGDEAGDLLGDSDLTRDMFAAGAEDLVDGFFAVSLVLMALIATAYTLSSVSRPRSQEEAGYAEMMLATGLTRLRWLAGQLAVCLLGTLVVIGSAGLGIALGYAMATGDGGGFQRFALPMLAQVAPVLVVLGFVVFMYGVFPRLQVAGWALLGFALVVLMFGEVLRFPEWVRWLSPFEHLALAPAETFRIAPFLTLLGVAVALTALGAFAFRRRDIA
jgi:ABC-2 type transport system permease protein